MFKYEINGKWSCVADYCYVLPGVMQRHEFEYKEKGCPEWHK